MKNFYELLQSEEKFTMSKAITVLDGKWRGARVLLHGHEIIASSGKADFLITHLENFISKKETGIINIKEVPVFCEVLSPEKKLVICGAGHVSIPIIKFGLMAEFHVTVIEDRVSFADQARKAGAHTVICKGFKEGLAEVEGDQNTYFVIVTRGHRFDQTCLEESIKKPHAYIGMIGSKRRVKTVKEEMIERGVSAEKLAGIYSPIGMDIKAETPVEIAISIMGEIILVKNKGSRGAGYPKDIIKELTGKNEEENEWIMATIVSRKGSAPRDIGTKMLIHPDGRIIGTIGGGCAESDVIRKALSMFTEEKDLFRLVKVDMTGEDAEEDGMVCGGVIEVFLEKIGRNS